MARRPKDRLRLLGVKADHPLYQANDPLYQAKQSAISASNKLEKDQKAAFRELVDAVQKLIHYVEDFKVE
jgi:hypothetical protein